MVETPQRKPFVVFQFEVNSAVVFWCYEEKTRGKMIEIFSFLGPT